MVQHQYNGLLYEPGEAQQLAASVAWRSTTRPSWPTSGAMRDAPTRRNFTSERNYAALLEIYQNTARPRSVGAVAGHLGKTKRSIRPLSHDHPTLQWNHTAARSEPRPLRF